MQLASRWSSYSRQYDGDRGGGEREHVPLTGYGAAVALGASQHAPNVETQSELTAVLRVRRAPEVAAAPRGTWPP
jgi:hypothetical protein